MAMEADAARLELCRNFTKLQAVFFSQRLTENATRNAASSLQDDRDSCNIRNGCTSL
jgi:hypothetical protein